jgi:hypothetical protein
MAKWRPEGWDNLKISEEAERKKGYELTDVELVEAGADAMLEALRNSKERRRVDTNITLDCLPPISYSIRGYEVFIPDDKQPQTVKN